MRRRSGRVRDFAVYILIGVTIVFAVFWLAQYNLSEDAFAKWFGLTGYSAGLFGVAIANGRRSWRKPVFWATMGCLLVSHTVCFFVFFCTVVHWRIVWFGLMYPIELVLVTSALQWAVQRSRDPNG